MEFPAAQHMYGDNSKALGPAGIIVQLHSPSFKQSSSEKGSAPRKVRHDRHRKTEARREREGLVLLGTLKLRALASRQGAEEPPPRMPLVRSEDKDEDLHGYGHCSTDDPLSHFRGQLRKVPQWKIDTEQEEGDGLVRASRNSTQIRGAVTGRVHIRSILSIKVAAAHPEVGQSNTGSDDWRSPDEDADAEPNSGSRYEACDQSYSNKDIPLIKFTDHYVDPPPELSPTVSSPTTSTNSSSKLEEANDSVHRGTAILQPKQAQPEEHGSDGNALPTTSPQLQTGLSEKTGTTVGHNERETGTTSVTSLEHRHRAADEPVVRSTSQHGNALKVAKANVLNKNQHSEPLNADNRCQISISAALRPVCPDLCLLQNLRGPPSVAGQFKLGSNRGQQTTIHHRPSPSLNPDAAIFRHKRQKQITSSNEKIFQWRQHVGLDAESCDSCGGDFICLEDGTTWFCEGCRARLRFETPAVKPAETDD